MKNIPTILILLPLLLAMIACHDPKPVTDTLHRAEALMHEHPDSAWTMLNTLSPDEMGQNGTRAHYALLYTQAQDKNYIDETNDSLISVAVDYYRHTDDVRHKFLSCYYKGRVLTNAKDYLNATTCYMEAEQLAGEVGDDYLVGLLYAELGRIYRLYYDYPKSLEAYQKSAECYERAGKIRHRNYIWYNQSSICRNLNESEESERLLRMALASAKEVKDNVLVELCIGNLVMFYIEEKRMSEAQKFYEELKAISGVDYGSASFMSSLTEMYVSVGDLIRAERYVEAGWERAKSSTDSINLYLSSAELYAKKGKNEWAYQELLKGVALQTKNAKEALQQPVLTAQRDYLSEKLAFEAYQLRVEKRLNFLYILLSLLILLMLSYSFYLIYKKIEKKSQQVISCLEEEKDKITERFNQLYVDKKKADLTIENLKDEIIRNEKEGNDKIAALLQKLDKDKEESNRSITELRRKLVEKVNESNAEITELLQEIEFGKEESNRSIAELKQKLLQKEEENHRSMLSLSEKMEQDKLSASKTIQELKNTIEEKKGKNSKMASLIQQLRDESKHNTEIITNLRAELEHRERELYEKLRQHSVCSAELFRSFNSDMGELWVVVKEKKVAVSGISKVIYRWEEDYCVGKKALAKLEGLVNFYCDNAMMHFRNEISLGDEMHYQRVCYWFAGISIKAVALLMGESKDNVYQRRLRLREKIEVSDCLHKQLFLKMLGK